ncbi:RNA-binding cell elongation regulator Jag/EloR [Paenibacillus sp. CMAA1739]|uniref:RNA-binding cell elongation regulator Jag/EloR n=1 Tax=Paenibacillus ottowii TaxID=2315729 RepID=UPI00273167E5|nr:MULTISPECIES: RNA-binding cell elongation regulator Jag/EloR [Paenibacillus]MDP1510744.1 RNA-binding cell elongation regulator Jag/EloR [Paenibacillus ottowii]MEC4566164.1 RNA-binding cell elongation regulator Jag/EloR [Paenibacillus sp. CMAA1739]
MTKVVTSGKTIEDAVRQGLSQLGVSRERVTVNVLEQPSKGFLGWLGVKKAKVELTLLSEPSPETTHTAEPHVSAQAPSGMGQAVSEAGPPAQEAQMNTEALGRHVDPYEEAVRFIRETAAGMGLNVEVDVRHRKDESTLDISGPSLGMLIGRRGQTLDALQYLTNIVANRHSDKFIRIVLDAEQFRARRRKTLEDLAERLANQAVRYGKEVVLEPMPSQERKLIHAKLQQHALVRTYSKGDEPNRRVVIAKK